MCFIMIQTPWGIILIFGSIFFFFFFGLFEISTVWVSFNANFQVRL